MFQTGVAEREINRVQRVSKLLTTLDGINSQAVHAEVNRWLGVRDTNIRTLWRIVSVGSWVESELSQHASNAFAALDEFRQGKEVIDNAEDSLHSAVR
jgi:hypothetical protein